MRRSTKWTLGGTLGLILLAIVAWVLVDALFGIVFFLVRVVLVIIVVAVAALVLRGMFSRSRREP